MICRIFLLFLAAAASALSQQPERVWTDEQGRQIKASLVQVKGDSAELLMPDGRKLTYPIAKLSKTDQAFVKRFELEAKSGQYMAAIPENFDAPWPESASLRGNPRIETIEENPEEKRFIYESANYRYHSDVLLLNTVVGGFAVMFEATHEYCRKLPLSLNSGVKTDGKYQILLFEKKEDYISAGGPPKSGGVYIPNKNTVMVPLTSLGVKKFGSGYTLDRERSNKTLPHELVHQLTPHAYYEHGSDGWFTEGVAEYVAVTPYRSGSFSVRSNSKAAIAYATAWGLQENSGRNLGTTLKIGPLKAFMLQPYSAFAGPKANFNYGCGLLISNYFFHMDGEGDAKRIKAFLKAMKAGKRGEEALAVLLDGRTWEQLQAEITAAYAKEKVTITF
jgi:hypothetical protein